MTNTERALDEIIEREGLAADIAQSAKFFGDTLPLTPERKAQHAKAAAQSKYRHSHTLDNDGKAAAICDEIDALFPATFVETFADFKKRVKGNEIDGWIVKDVRGANKRNGILSLVCPHCGEKQERTMSSFYTRGKLKKCLCQGKKNLKKTKSKH